MPNTKSKMPADVGFSLGFFCGSLLGSLGMYLIATKEGQELKQLIAKEFKVNQQEYMLRHLPTSADQVVSDQPPAVLVALRQLITKVRHKIIAENHQTLIKHTINVQKSKKKRYFKKK